MIDSEMTMDVCTAVLQNLEETVNCYTCKKILTVPTKIDLCKHNFCYECIFKENICPVCGMKFTKSDLVVCPFESIYLSLFSKYERLLFFIRSKIKTPADTTSCSNFDNTSLDLNLKISNVRSLNVNRITHSNNGGTKVKSVNRNLIQKKKPEKEIKIEIDKRNPQGETPLFLACLKNDSLEVLRLLKAGANPNVKDNAGWTPLSETVIGGQVDIVKMLLKHGACVNTPSARNTTPLIEAVVVGNTDIIHILLKHGADINMRNITGDSPLSSAKTKNIKSLLVNAKPMSYLTPKVPSEVTPVVFCCNMNKEEMIEAQKTCNELNIELKTDFTTDVTHIVTKTNYDNTCNCNFAVLRGIVAGVRIVSYNWITRCKISNMVIPSRKYQVDGTKDYPNIGIVKLSTLNTFKLYPKLFSGVYISLTGCFTDRNSLSKSELIILVQESGATYLPRHPDPENIPNEEKTVPFHSNPSSLMGFVSHIILYEPKSNPKKEPKLKYNMKHLKTLSTTWFFKCIQTFSICDP